MGVADFWRESVAVRGLFVVCFDIYACVVGVLRYYCEHTMKTATETLKALWTAVDAHPLSMAMALSIMSGSDNAYATVEENPSRYTGTDEEIAQLTLGSISCEEDVPAYCMIGTGFGDVSADEVRKAFKECGFNV